MLGSLGPTEIIIILFAILLLFGGKKIPEFARGIGRGIREFRNSVLEVKQNLEIDETTTL